MSVATMTAKGQFTMPKVVREQLKLTPGDRVEFLISDDGRVTVWPVTADVTTLKGIVPKPMRTVTLQAIRKALRKRGAGL